MHEDLDKKELNQGNQLLVLQGCTKIGFLITSYVILERAVPSVEDGFKPVQQDYAINERFNW